LQHLPQAHRWTGPAGAGGVLVHARFEGFETFEEREHDQPHAQGSLLPVLRWYAKTLWKGGRLKPITHTAISSCS